MSNSQRQNDYGLGEISKILDEIIIKPAESWRAQHQNKSEVSNEDISDSPKETRLGISELIRNAQLVRDSVESFNNQKNSLEELEALINSLSGLVKLQQERPEFIRNPDFQKERVRLSADDFNRAQMHDKARGDRKYIFPNETDDQYKNRTYYDFQLWEKLKSYPDLTAKLNNAIKELTILQQEKIDDERRRLLAIESKLRRKKQEEIDTFERLNKEKQNKIRQFQENDDFFKLFSQINQIDKTKLNAITRNEIDRLLNLAKISNDNVSDDSCHAHNNQLAAQLKVILAHEYVNQKNSTLIPILESLNIWKKTHRGLSKQELEKIRRDYPFSFTYQEFRLTLKHKKTKIPDILEGKINNIINNTTLDQQQKLRQFENIAIQYYYDLRNNNDSKTKKLADVIEGFIKNSKGLNLVEKYHIYIPHRIKNNQPIVSDVSDNAKIQQEILNHMEYALSPFPKKYTHLNVMINDLFMKGNYNELNSELNKIINSREFPLDKEQYERLYSGFIHPYRLYLRYLEKKNEFQNTPNLNIAAALIELGNKTKEWDKIFKLSDKRPTVLVDDSALSRRLSGFVAPTTWQKVKFTISDTLNSVMNYNYKESSKRKSEKKLRKINPEVMAYKDAVRDLHLCLGMTRVGKYRRRGYDNITHSGKKITHRGNEKFDQHSAYYLPISDNAAQGDINLTVIPTVSLTLKLSKEAAIRGKRGLIIYSMTDEFEHANKLRPIDIQAIKDEMRKFMQDNSIDRGADFKIIQKQTPFSDFGFGIEPQNILKTVYDMRRDIESGYDVIIHCKAGKARSADVLAVYMAIYGNLHGINIRTNENGLLINAADYLNRERSQVDLHQDEYLDMYFNSKDEFSKALMSEAKKNINQAMEEEVDKKLINENSNESDKIKSIAGKLYQGQKAIVLHQMLVDQIKEQKQNSSYLPSNEENIKMHNKFIQYGLYHVIAVYGMKFNDALKEIIKQHNIKSIPYHGVVDYLDKLDSKQRSSFEELVKRVTTELYYHQQIIDLKDQVNEFVSQGGDGPKKAEVLLKKIEILELKKFHIKTPEEMELLEFKNKVAGSDFIRQLKIAYTESKTKGVERDQLREFLEKIEVANNFSDLYNVFNQSYKNNDISFYVKYIKEEDKQHLFFSADRKRELFIDNIICNLSEIKDHYAANKNIKSMNIDELLSNLNLLKSGQVTNEVLTEVKQKVEEMYNKVHASQNAAQKFFKHKNYIDSRKDSISHSVELINKLSHAPPPPVQFIAP